MLALLLVLAQDAPTREERVLELLRELRTRGAGHYGAARYGLAAPPIGARPVVLAQNPEVMCANSDEGTVDAADMRRSALALCAAYGLAPEADVRLDGIAALLDGLDPSARIGFELRGDGSDEFLMGSPPEPESDALDATDLEALAAGGHRVFVADVNAYRTQDGDRFTHSLALLAGLVRFLDDVTEGEDVDLGGLLFERESMWDWPSSGTAVPDGVRANSAGNFVVERAATLSVRCAGLADFGLPRPTLREIARAREECDRLLRARAVVSTRGAPSVLHFTVGSSSLDGEPPRPVLRLRVRQGELVHETVGPTAFLPSAFELAEPFEVELELAPGRYTFWTAARIGGAARD